MSEHKSTLKENKKNSSISSIAEWGNLSRVSNCITQSLFTRHLGSLDEGIALVNLMDEEKKVREGNLEHIENILLAQAHALDAMFNNLAAKAADAQWINHLESLLRLSLKAQSQCRTTIESLANIKNPPNVSFVKQANIGHNQQVNNFPLNEDEPRARENKNQQNQLLEEKHGERLDTRAAKTSINVD